MWANVANIVEIHDTEPSIQPVQDAMQCTASEEPKVFVRRLPRSRSRSRNWRRAVVVGSVRALRLAFLVSVFSRQPCGSACTTRVTAGVKIARACSSQNAICAFVRSSHRVRNRNFSQVLEWCTATRPANTGLVILKFPIELHAAYTWISSY